MERKTLSKIFAVAQNVLNECIRHKILNILVLFAIAMIGGAFVIKELSPGAEARTLLDTGYAFIEIFGFLSVILSIFITTFEEFEMRNIWITLTKPIGRTTYAFGKFTGITLTLFLNISIMSILLIGLALLNNIPLGIDNLYIVLSIFLSLIIVIAFTLLFSFVSANLASGIIYSSGLFVVAHLTEHLKTLINKETTGPFLKIILSFFYYILPNLSFFNIKDKLYLFNDISLSSAYMLKITLYTAVYSGICMIIASYAFKNKEL